MAGQDNNTKGDTAESLVHALFNRLNLSCRVIKLGGKWPITDMYVEITNKNLVPYFFIQVKSTDLGYSATNKLKVQVPKIKLNKLAKYKAPTYLVGVDMNDTRLVPNAFIATIRGKYPKGIATMPATTRHKITKATLAKLEKEVIEFWRNSPNTQKGIYKTNFELK